MSEKIDKDWQKIREQMREEEATLDEALDASAAEGDEASLSNALEHPSYVDLEERLTLAEQKAHDHWEKLVRATAELDNIRRRAEREVASAHRYGTEKLINALLPVVDSLDHALQLAEQTHDEAMHQGLALTMKLFVDALQKQEVKQLDPLGESFNPQLHEAMSIQESPGTPANTILAVFQKGYTLHDRVIRPARVVVSK